MLTSNIHLQNVHFKKTSEVDGKVLRYPREKFEEEINCAIKSAHIAVTSKYMALSLGDSIYYPN